MMNKEEKKNYINEMKKFFDAKPKIRNCDHKDF